MKLRLKAAVIMAVALGTANLALPAAESFTAPAQIQGAIRVYYTIDHTLRRDFSGNNVEPITSSVHAADNAWRIQNLMANADFYDDPNQPNAHLRRLVSADIDGPGPRYAQALTDSPVGNSCRNNNSTCNITFEPGNPPAPNGWNTTATERDDTWLDFIGHPRVWSLARHGTLL